MTGNDQHATDSCYRDRVDALDAVWCRWSEIGAGLSEQQWSSATRCPGWDVAGLSPLTFLGGITLASLITYHRTHK
ncbi:MAG TPA: maleylpyruvate isomerase N-terminal domain-containing protein [Jiangellaceae bacterium]|nr:maleylpyruvate isomerase N-terminal domain-containing protein [Jiangellaceae bacterium]